MTIQKVAIVSGASRGFGRAVTLELLRADWTVIGDGRDETALSKLCHEASAISADLHVVPGDVTDSDHIADVVRNASHFGTVGLVINNASTLGQVPRPSVLETDLIALRRTFETNLIAPLAILQAVWPLLSDNAALVNVSSDAAAEGYPGWAGYGASKAALDIITGSLGQEVTQSWPDRRSYAIDPGEMNTGMLQAAYPGEDISDRAAPELASRALLELLKDRPASGRYSL